MARIERTVRGEWYGRTSETAASLDAFLMRRSFGDGWNLTLGSGETRFSIMLSDADVQMLESVLGRRRTSAVCEPECLDCEDARAEAREVLDEIRAAEGAEVVGDD